MNEIHLLTTWEHIIVFGLLSIPLAKLLWWLIEKAFDI